MLSSECFDLDYPLKGFFDTHVHTAPDVKNRIQDDIELALSAKDADMGGVVIKSHIEPTSGRSLIASKLTGFDVYGGVTLNKSVGGLNPFAVKSSADMGGKFVWFPTVNYPNISMDWDSIEDILNIIADNKMILATGHLKPDDIFKLIDMAHSTGIWRILVNHPQTKVVNASIDEQIEMSRHAYLEQCFVACMEKHDNINQKEFASVVQSVGTKNCVMATDFGQTHNPLPVQGLEMFVNSMLDNGLSMSDIRVMCIENPEKLIRI